jgi:energy-coupling factor transport system ATP-binding protein
VIDFERVTITYADATEPVLRDVTLHVPEGELCLVVGRTGSGKSTLLGAVNGLVPHFTGGTLAGTVRVGGRSTADHPPRELADVVGLVGQDPLAGFVTDTVEEELAFTMEQLALPPATMRKRVEETLDLLGIADLRRAALRDLSGGQQQRVAIGAALTAHPAVLVLDEPTSALDPGAAEDVLAAITRLVHDLGLTVLLAEHRLERVVQYADEVLHVGGDGSVRAGAPAEVLAHVAAVPPIVELGRLAGWQPLPLSVRDARRQAAPLRERLAGYQPPAAAVQRGASSLSARKVTVRYGDVVAVDGVDLELFPGEVTALMGRNGSGKSSLLWALHGAGPRHSGSVRTSGPVALVPQTPADLLFRDTVRAELDAAATHGASRQARELLDDLTAGAPRIADDTHPRDLSEGQRLALVLALMLCAEPDALLLDEPTRGLDYPAKDALAGVLNRLAEGGRAVLVCTHDVEFAAAVAARVVVLAEGQVVADGASADVLAASPAFAPQVAKILAPLPVLTVAQVVAALGDGAS